MSRIFHPCTATLCRHSLSVVCFTSRIFSVPREYTTGRLRLLTGLQFIKNLYR